MVLTYNMCQELLSHEDNLHNLSKKQDSDTREGNSKFK